MIAAANWLTRSKAPGVTLAQDFTGDLTPGLWANAPSKAVFNERIKRVTKQVDAKGNPFLRINVVAPTVGGDTQGQAYRCRLNPAWKNDQDGFGTTPFWIQFGFRIPASRLIPWRAGRGTWKFAIIANMSVTDPYGAGSQSSNRISHVLTNSARGGANFPIVYVHNDRYPNGQPLQGRFPGAIQGSDLNMSPGWDKGLAFTNPHERYCSYRFPQLGCPLWPTDVWISFMLRIHTRTFGGTAGNELDLWWALPGDTKWTVLQSHRDYLVGSIINNWQGGFNAIWLTIFETDRLRPGGVDTYVDYRNLLVSTQEPAFPEELASAAPSFRKPYTVNGAGFDTLQAAFDAARPGAVIQASGTIFNDAAVLRTANVTLRGPATLDGGGASAEDKALIVVKAPGFLVEGIEARNIAAPDGNGAFIRLEAEGDLRLRRCHVHDAQQGILTRNDLPNGRLILEDCVFERLGDGSGRVHGIHIGRIAELRIRGGRYGDCIRSRAAKTIIDGAQIHEGRAAHAIDLPDGGVVEIAECGILRTQAADSSGIIAYGAGGRFWANNAFHFYASNSVTHIGAPSGTTFNFRFEPEIKLVENHTTRKAPPVQAKGRQVTPAYDSKGNVLDSWWAGLPLNEWVEVVGTDLMSKVTPLLPSGFKDFGVEGLSGVFHDWSGAAFDRATGRMWFNGGGHQGSSNNGVYEFALERMAWRIAMQPSIYTQQDLDHSKASWNASVGQPGGQPWIGYSQGYEYPNYFWKDGKPTALHTYKGFEWNSDTKRIMRAGRGNIWHIDPLTGEFVRGGLNRIFMSNLSSASYDPHTGKWILFHTDGNHYWDYRVYLAATDTLSPLKTTSESKRTTPYLSIATIGRKVYCFQDLVSTNPAPHLFTIDLDTEVKADVPLTNHPPRVQVNATKWTGHTYATCADYSARTQKIYVLQRAVSPGVWGSFTTITADGKCDVYTPSGIPSPFAVNQNSPYSKFRIYERAEKAFIVLFNLANANLRLVRLA